VQLLQHRRRRPHRLVLRERLARSRRISGLISFEPDKITVHLDGTQLRLEPGQNVIPHGIDRDLTPDEFADGRQS